MLIYHASDIIVENPDISLCRKRTDFGQGFYTTTNYEQAQKWAKIKADRRELGQGFISIYEFDKSVFETSDLNVFRFFEPTEKWLDFVVSNRKNDIKHTYDIVEGPVANDRLYATITLFEQGILSAKACIEQLQTHKLFDQLSFHTDKALSYLKFTESQKI